jgi:membrane glycosyltransferase
LTPDRSTPSPDMMSAVPGEIPCPMPEQTLWRPPTAKANTTLSVMLARAAVTSIAVSGTALFGWTLYRVLSVESPTPLQLVFWLLSTLCFSWIALGSASAIIGFIALMTRRRVDTVRLSDAAARPSAKTALLFPVYNENPRHVAATIETLAAELEQAGATSLFDVFVLSDTQGATDREREAGAYGDLRARYEGRLQIFFRWRTPNTAKKAGNIRDWIERFGGGYPYFIIFDADSIMSAATLLRLAATMDTHPRAGLIQSIPRLVGGRTLFARLQQFAANTYGRVVVAGLAAWHGPGGNYWGHNAIIRTGAFASAAGLPPLPGRPPLGGAILSHDFVEAALLRRARWDVHLVPSLEGSYEGCPPTLTELIVRDRRWAQGNLQHLRLLGVNGLPFLSRVHLAMGAFSYIASPLWALTLIVGVTLSFEAKFTFPSYFGSEITLFPKWPVFDAQTALVLFCATIFVVHLPKVLGVIWALRNPAENGGGAATGRLLAGLLVESLFSMLIAPILMLTQTGAVLSILLGRDAGWGAQQRASSGATFATLLRVHRWHIAWGAITAGLCIAISTATFAWMSPIIAGLLLSAPIVMLTGRAPPVALRRVLDTPEDHAPPAVLVAQQAAIARPHGPGH